MAGLHDKVSVRVPASTSNCGPGFDTIGIALGLFNLVSLEREKGSAIVSSAGPSCPALSLVEEAAARFFSSAEIAPFGFRYQISGNVPRSRGLGSSVTVRAGIAAGLNALSGAGLGKFELAAIVSLLEGHPDNATAGVLGGFCVGRSSPDDGRLLDVARFEVPDSLAFVVASPDMEVKTSDSRGVLPTQVPFADAVRSVNGAGFFIAAFATGEFERLRNGFDDFLHEPYRLPGIIGAADALKAGQQAGALGAWLSGSGSSLACLVFGGDSSAVSGAMSASLQAAGVSHMMRTLRADNQGLIVTVS